MTEKKPEQLELFTEQTCEVMSDEYGAIGVLPCGKGEWIYLHEETTLVDWGPAPQGVS